jgi:serine/threonine-protein phosphatase 6 regulatory ankyrin repeat subunit B
LQVVIEVRPYTWAEEVGMHWAIIESHNEVVRTLLNNAVLQPSQEQLNKALICASEGGNEEAAEALIGRGAEISGRDVEGSTPIDWAVPEGRECVVRMLLKHGARLDMTDNYGNICLHWAILHPQIARLLLENGYNVNTTNMEGIPPLFWSVQAGELEFTRIFLEFGADINHQGPQGITALHKAALECNEAMVELLLQNCAQPNIQDAHRWTPLQAAAVREHQGSVHLLLGGSDDGQTILQHVALRLTQPDDRALLEHMAETKSGGSDVVGGLRSAANSGQVERVKALLERRADINAIDAIGGSTALTMATWLSKRAVVELFIH